MYLDNIQLTNYRQYQKAKLEFATSPDANFTVIIGANGSGKTNLLNAVTWCLFGEEMHLDKKYQGLPIVNTTTLNSMKSNDSCDVKISIQLIQKDGKKIIVSRSTKYRKNLKGNPQEMPTYTSLTYMYETEREWKGPVKDNAAQYRINELLPKSIEEYFFFDGERLNEYFRVNTGKDIQTAVFKISQLELLNKVILHLTARRNDHIKSARNLSPEADKIRNIIGSLNKLQTEEKNTLQNLVKKQEVEARKEQHFRELLRNSSVERIQVLEEQRTEIDKDVFRTNEEIKRVEANKLHLLHTNMPRIFSYNALIKTSNLIQNRKEAGLIPPPYDRIFIENLLRKGACICGSDITEKDVYSAKRRKNVTTFLEISQLSNISNELVETNVNIVRILENLHSFPEEYIDIEKRLRRLLETYTEKNRRLQEISQDISLSNSDNIKKWEESRKTHEKSKQNYDVMIRLKKKEIETLESNIQEENNNLRKEIRREKQNKELEKKLDFCSRGITYVKEIKETIMNNVKTEIERKTSEQFLDMIWKKKTYRGVVIDDNYNISVPDMSGREGFGTLSAGERQVCALAFMAALNYVSGFQVPIVIDTPFARLSSEPRRNIGKSLPNYLQGSQVTLLVTEEEYTSEMQEALSTNVGKTYAINYSELDLGGLAEIEEIP